MRMTDEYAPRRELATAVVADVGRGAMSTVANLVVAGVKAGLLDQEMRLDDTSRHRAWIRLAQPTTIPTTTQEIA